MSRTTGVLARDESWVRQQGVFHRDRGDRIVALLSEGEQTILLDATAAAMWRLLDRPTSLATLASLLANQFGVAAEDVVPDIAAGLDALEAAGLVTRCS